MNRYLWPFLKTTFWDKAVQVAQGDLTKARHYKSRLEIHLLLPAPIPK